MQRKDVVARKVHALNSFIQQKEEYKKKHPLKYLFWEATLRCNLNCHHCGSDCMKDNTSLPLEIDGNLIKKELLDISKHYPPQKITFAIIGGEPLLREDLFDIGGYAASLGFYWGITTNGTLLNKKNIRQLKEANLKTISVSLDGLEKENDALRNSPGSYQVVTEAVQRLVDDPFYKTFDIICCVNKLNINHLEGFVEKLIQLGVPALRFVPIFSHGRASRNQHLMLEKADLVKLLHFVAKKRKDQKKIRINLGEEGYFGPEWECVVRDSFHYCGSGILIGSILYNGDITGCPSISRKFVEGNLKDRSFLKVWKNNFFSFRFGKEKLFAKKCSDCEHWILCEGGGFHLLEQNQVVNHCQFEKIGEGKNDRF